MTQTRSFELDAAIQEAPLMFPMDIDCDDGTSISFTNLISAEDINVVGEVEIPYEDITDITPDIPLQNKQQFSQPPTVQHDHDYVADVNHVVECMERLVLTEQKCVKLKNQLRNKQKEASRLKKTVCTYFFWNLQFDSVRCFFILRPIR